MRKILKSGAISVSDDVYTITDVALRKSATVILPDGETADVEMQQGADADTEAVAQMVIQKAVEQADRIMGEARERMEAERSAVLQKAQQQAAMALEQARQDGATEGARGQIEATRSCITQLETAICRLEGELAGFTADYERDLKWLALEIASKVLNKRIQENDTDMAELVRGAVNAVKSAQWITVRISDEMPGLLDVLANSLRTAEGSRVEIQDVPTQRGTCIVETPDGVIDASLYTQLENLKDYFKNE